MNKKMFVQSLEKSTARVLFAMLFAGTALNTKNLQQWTGMKRETIYLATETLQSAGLLTIKNLGHGLHLYLPAGDMLPFFQMSAQRTPELSTTTTDSIPILNQDNESVVTVPAQMSAQRTPAKVSRQSLTPNFDEYAGLEYETHGASFEANWKACKQKGIGEPSRTKLSVMAHVSPDLIKAHVDSLQRERGESIGLAIMRIAGDELPRSWEEQARQAADENPRDVPND